MIQTDKYKKGIVALILKAAELNPLLGNYQTHYLNEDARFIVQLSNGQLEIEIETARQYEQDPGKMLTGKLQQLVFNYKKAQEKSYRSSSEIDSAWRKLFSQKKDIKTQQSRL